MTPKRYTAPAVTRAVQILEHLSQAGSPPTLSELSRDLGLQKSTAHGLLAALEEAGWVEKEGARGGYRLGAPVLSLSRKTPGLRELRDAARPHLRELAEVLGESVFLGVRDGDRVVIREVEEGRNEMRVAARPGAGLPLLAAATGKAVLAGLEPDQARRYLESSELVRFTERSIGDVAGFLDEVEATRARGFGTDDEEYLRGVRAVAVLVPWGRRPEVLLWAVGLVSSFSPAMAAEAGRKLRAAAVAVARELEG